MRLLLGQIGALVMLASFVAMVLGFIWPGKQRGYDRYGPHYPANKAILRCSALLALLGAILLVTVR